MLSASFATALQTKKKNYIVLVNQFKYFLSEENFVELTHKFTFNQE